MSVAFYMDVHVRRSVTDGLRRRGVDVLTAQEDGMATARDPDLLDRATLLGRAMFTQDVDLLIEATARQRSGIAFGGVVFAHQQEVPIGRCIEDLALIAHVCEPREVADLVEFLPL